ncbi:hypothetical protein FBEOM_5036 [Fusarium beomiforme]|uniref:Uncharacterized protein n=1 Tax=Fusarium beomiforme TaxID=44412 RepID=A0A9P5ALK7_9HYPO|nr:hypothetical protein FBEOM_5036 [Fusarium beomiforme]
MSDNTVAPTPPTARQAVLKEHFDHYLRLSKNGQALEALRTAKALLEENDLDDYQKAHLHTKLSEVPELGVYHATMALRIYKRLAYHEPDNQGLAASVESLKKLLNQQRYEERDFEEHAKEADPQAEQARRQQRYDEYFAKLEQEAKPTAADEKKDRDDPNPEVYLPNKKRRFE